MSSPATGPDGFPYWVKDPDAAKDYQVDWTAWLAGDSISSYTVTAQSGLTKDSDSRSGAVVTVWLSGGMLGRTYLVTVRVVTSGGRTDERSFNIIVRQQ